MRYAASRCVEFYVALYLTYHPNSRRFGMPHVYIQS